MRGDPPKPEFIYKKLCIYSYMFKLQSPSKYSPLEAILKTVFNSLILMPFSASAPFCFTSSTWAKCFHVRTSFIRETNKQKIRSG